jgi:cell division protein FtsI (penicillin-binding protein 3)
MSKGFASNRLTLLAMGVIACFMGVCVRLVFLQMVDRESLLQFVDKARRQIVVEHARRGTILDTHGDLLATSRSELTLAVDPWMLMDYLAEEKNEARRNQKRVQQENLRAQCAALLGMPATELEKFFEPKMRSAAIEKDTKDGTPDGLVKDRWVKLKEGVDEPTFAMIQQLKVGDKTVKLQGLTFERVYRRVYPSGGLASHVIGYLNKEGMPVTGVERQLDLYLKGQDGWIESEKDGARRELAQFRSREVPVRDGNDVVLTIDSVVQHIIEDELKTIAAKFHPHFATIIASDPQTGAILGMANYPSFDLNNFNKASPDSLKNAATEYLIEPGSTFKIVAAGAALNEGLVTPASSFDCGITSINYHGRDLKLPKEDHPFEQLTVAEIVSHSSNRGAAQLAMLMGDEKYYEYVRKYGFGRRTELSLGVEERGILEPPKRWDGLTITRMPMGHAVAATPLQIHMAMSAVANSGALLRPHIFKEIRDTTGNVIRTFAPEKREQVLKPSTAALLAQLLHGVVTEGTAKGFDVAGFEVAGKTGTAQKIIDGKYSNSRYVASFVGFFPASRPQVVLSVIVDDAQLPKGVMASGRNVSAPSFQRIAEQLIQYFEIKPVTPVTRNLLAMQGGAL